MNWKYLRIQYVARLFIILIFVQFSLFGTAQKTFAKKYIVTIQGNNISLNSIFIKIKQQTKLSLMSETAALDLEEKTTVNFYKIELDSVLYYLLVQKGLEFKITEDAILVRKKNHEHSIGRSTLSGGDSLINISGFVYGEHGEALPGATILLRNTNKGATTDGNGKFLFDGIFKNSFAVISYTGYESKIVKFSGDVMYVKLKVDIRNMQAVDVVSTGYQQLPRERATGSFDFINKKVFNEQVTTDVLSRLEPIANGLTVNRTSVNGAKNPTGIVIRGLSTINGPSSPLIVVDNFPYEGDLNNINPNDVESVTILKDAAASSIWGTRAGNGVIVITTKRAKFNNKVSVEAVANFTIVDKPDLFKLKTISPKDEVYVEGLLFKNGYYNNMETDAYSHPILPDVVEILIAQRDGKISQQEADNELQRYSTHDVRNDYDKYFYRRAINQQYYATLKGGTQNISWLLSTGLDRNTGATSDKYNKLNLRSENTVQVLKNLQVSAGVFFTQSDAYSGKPAYGSISNATGGIPSYTFLATPDGQPVSVSQNYRQSFLDTIGNGKLLDWNYYPLTDYKYQHNQSDIQDLNLHIDLDYTPIKDLSFGIKYQVEFQNSKSESLSDLNSYAARNQINFFTQIDPNTDAITYGVPKGGIDNLFYSNLKSDNLRGQVSYLKDIKKYSFNIIGGMEFRQISNSSNSYAIYGYSADNLSHLPVDYASPHLNIINGGDAYLQDGISAVSTLNRFVSYYTNAAMTYDEKYTFSISGRKDASNLFGVNTNEKWKPLGSAGLAWNIYKEPFYKPLESVIPFLKIRTTYGFSGNVDPSLSAVTVLGIAASNPYLNSTVTVPVQFYNPDLKWETVAMFNAGIDFSLTKNIISGSIEYYRKRAFNLLSQVPVDYTNGLGQSKVTKNVANMKGNGVDIQLNTVNINRKVKWTTTLNFSHSVDKVEKYYTSSTTAGQFAGGSSISGIIGKPVYSLFAYKWAGLDHATGNPLGYFNGKVSEAYDSISGVSSINDLAYIGPRMPQIYGSLGNTISWNNISLSIRLTYKFGYYFLRNSINYSSLFSSSGGHSDFSKRWMQPGDEKKTNVPSLIYPSNDLREGFYASSQVLATKGDNIRVQYISLEYHLLGNKFRIPGFKDINVYLSVNNLGILWRANKFNIDPDYSENSVLPSKSFIAGIRLAL